MTSVPLAARLTRAQGPLFFPVTAYGPDGGLDLEAFHARVRGGVAAAFAPDIALAFHRVLGAGDDKTVNRLLDGFFVPLVALRDEGRRYAVSLVKAGVRLGGLAVGCVRPPLTEPADRHIEAPPALIEKGRALLKEGM
ncbi:hypothetical protein AB0903_33320 [Streptomyces sp. NPDC048389]|uniref:hypothetical protein n=1 Tax=Streptomyces sp. NPDC048389 TaxID=3154622 RepID=UPI003457047B